MPNVGDQGFVTRDPQVYKTAIIGTAVGTTTISSVPVFFKGIQITHRPASSTFIFYESIGTSASVIGTITMGTFPAGDPVPFIPFNRSCSALSIAHTTANAGAIAMFNTG